jgi:hypothetical protein
VYKFFSIYLILSVAIGPRDHSASNRNEYHKQKIMYPVSRARPVSGILNISQSYRPSRPVTGIA